MQLEIAKTQTNNPNVKKLILIAILIPMISFAGIDEMKQRDAGQPPAQHSDIPGQGGGLENNPNVPIDDMMIWLFAAVAITGVWAIRIEHKKT